MVHPGLSRDPFRVVSMMVPSVIITGIAVPVITPVVGPVVAPAIGVWVCAGKSK